MKLLHLDSSVLGEHSVSRGLSAAVVARLRGADPTLEVTYHDLAARPIAHLSGAYLAAAGGAPLADIPGLAADVDQGRAALEDFLAADIVVIGLGLYNFSIPSQLKAWIDRIAVAGKTFRYSEAGPVGLAGGKRLVLAIARGGLYGPGMPGSGFEFGETYLRAVFGFLGIHNPEVIVAEGIALGAEHRAESVRGALAQIAELPLAA
jgi:FMN-dependent NADH-azoreductase